MPRPTPTRVSAASLCTCSPASAFYKGRAVEASTNPEVAITPHDSQAIRIHEALMLVSLVARRLAASSHASRPAPT